MLTVKAPEPRRRPLIYAVPLLGWMLRDLAEGGESALGWFLVSIVAGAAVLTLLFGLPGLVLGLLGVTALALVALIFVSKP